MSVGDAVEEAAEGGKSEAREWLREHMASLESGWALSGEIKQAARKARISESSLKRAKKALGIEDVTLGQFPARTALKLPGVAIQTEMAEAEVKL